MIGDKWYRIIKKNQSHTNQIKQNPTTNNNYYIINNAKYKNIYSTPQTVYPKSNQHYKTSPVTTNNNNYDQYFQSNNTTHKNIYDYNDIFNNWNSNPTEQYITNETYTQNQIDNNYLKDFDNLNIGTEQGNTYNYNSNPIVLPTKVIYNNNAEIKQKQIQKPKAKVTKLPNTENYMNDFIGNQLPSNDNNNVRISNITNVTQNKAINNEKEANKNKTTQRNQFSKEVHNNIIYSEVGIINLGNTCFMNSCLQILIHCPLFIYKFFDKFILYKNKNDLLSFRFYLVCHDIMATQNKQEKYIDISNFRNFFGLKHPTFGGYIQNDSQEFCRVFLEDISNELNQVQQKPLYKEFSINENDKENKRALDTNFDFDFKKREDSIVTQIFYSQIINTFICECKHKTYSFQKILDFPLLIPENRPKIGIYDLLNIYFQPEQIDFETQCEGCKKIQKHQKQTKISRPPEVLIFSLQGINKQTNNKYECLVDFPMVLNMGGYIDPECGFDKEKIYDLFAILNHQGIMEVGHYFSYIKFHQRNEWYEFNDSSVKKIEQKMDKFPYAYALFYIKKKHVE